MKTRGFTLVELAVASSISLVLLGVLYGVWRLLFGSTTLEVGADGALTKRHSSVVGLTTGSFARKEARMALQQLVNCLSEGIKVIEPAVGHTSGKLTFCDALNRRVYVRPDDKGVYRSYAEEAGDIPEESGVVLKLPDGTSQAVRPAIEIRQCESLVFTAVSPTLLTIKVTISESGQRKTLLAAARLGNSHVLGY